MGRTLPTYRIILDQEKLHWNRLMRAYLRHNQRDNDRMWAGAHRYSDAASFWSSGLYKQKILITILLDQMRQIKELEKKIQELETSYQG
ncbi:MAG: hypothetical protein HeimC3_05960 [Candidatus Heimdallarchaeota archaeon LC_3]|nr:MAG: hypothetical protein HeimC3_05960 [Candidatus Heimdallarchaeota archaeon LC_3]